MMNNQMNYQTRDDDVSIDVISLLSSFLSNSCKCLLFIVSMFFSFFIVILSITSDLETSLLSVSAEKTTSKISRVENVIEMNIAAIVLDFLQIISSNEIAISNRNAEKMIQSEQVFSAKESSNDVERQHSDAASSSLSSDV